MSAVADALAERYARRARPEPAEDIFDRLGYVPTPRQQEFHDATEFAVLYGGAAGGGKSRALLMDGIQKAMRYPGIRIGAFRRTYGELKESLLAELLLIQGQLHRLHWATYNGTEYELRFANDSLMMFRYAESLVDATRRQGGQYQLLLFDERTLMAPDVPTFLESRLRSGRKDIPVIGVRSGSNPGGPGHAAVKKAYIDATEYGTKIVTDARGRLVRFIPSKLADNPHVNPEYEADLNALPDAMRKAFKDGSWDAFAGQVFTEWHRDRHIVPAFPIPESWPRYAGIDWGFAAPWAVEWAAVDEDARVWIYRELTATQVGEADQAKRILAAEEGEPLVARYADDAMWTGRGDAKSVADIYDENGCLIVPAHKGERLSGWQRVHSYLADGPACPHHREAGWETCPRLHVLDGAAPELVRTLPALPYDRAASRVEDVDSKAEDHQADALRYLLINLAEPTITGWLTGSDAVEEVITNGAPEWADLHDYTRATFMEEDSWDSSVTSFDPNSLLQ